MRKFASTGAASTVVFGYALDGKLLGEYDGTGKALREYVGLGNTPVAMFTPDAANVANPPVVYFIQTDHLDTPRIVVDRNDKRRWRWLAEPFGTAAPETNPDGLGVFTQNLRFPGQYADVESGLFYNYFRDYDASAGRYSTSDPIGLGGGINTFSYVESDPVNYVDPDRLEKMIFFGPTDHVMQSMVANDPDIPWALIIYGHGNTMAIADDRVKRTRLTAAQVAELVKASGFWRPGMKIPMRACEVGRDPDGFDQLLANALGVPVSGPNGCLQVLPSKKRLCSWQYFNMDLWATL